MAFEENKVLFGHDPTERLVAVEFEEPNGVTLYLRKPDGSNEVRQSVFHPFLWSDEAPPEETGATIRQLAGGLPLGVLLEFESWKAFSRVRTGLRNLGRKSYTLSDPVQQFLLSTGMTLFKGMQFDDLRRMQIAIETFRGEGAEFSSAQRASDHLMSIALSDNTGWEEVLFVDPAEPALSEQTALERLTAIIRERDPDVIEGHDLFRVTLSYLAARARLAKVKLSFGRDGSVPRSRASRLQFAEKTVNYPKFQVHGRHFVDTALLSQFYDITARELESYGLAEVARHFHIPGEIALSEREIQAAYLEDPPVLVAHAQQTARHTRELAGLLSGSYFVQTKIFPYSYQDAVVRGNATKIDALLLREYYREGHSIPDLPSARDFEGGYTAVLYTGIARGVWHCDVASLYPSVMLCFDVFPAADKLGLFKGLLTDLRQFRLEAKASMRGQLGVSKRDYSYFHALQSTFKILINSFYGYLGFAQAHFADFDAASRVTQTGRDLLRTMMEWLQARGATVIEVDTDGLYFIPPEGEAEEALRQGLEAALPCGIDVELDAKFPAMFSYKAKNYALLTPEGELIIRGGALRSRGLEKFQRNFLEEMIKLLLQGKGEGVAALHADFERKIRGREWPIELLMKTDTLQDSLGQYARKIEGSSRNRAAAYELASRSGRNFQPGDQVSYYITGVKKNVSAYENSKLATEWREESRDENVEYYVAKLNDLVKKFTGFFEAATREPLPPPSAKTAPPPPASAQIDLL